MRRFVLSALILGMCILLLNAEEAKSGWSWGGVPAVAYNSDNGFTYGIIVQPFHYGDGSMYPDYLFSIYTELSRTTKGGGINKIFFDSKYLLPRDIRITSELSFLTEQALPFYGFNGYNEQYNPDFEDDGLVDAGYISRVFYRHAREQFRFTADFQKQVFHPAVRGVFGIGLLNTTVSPVDIDKLNEGQDEADMLPDTSSLFDQYVTAGYIPADQSDGGAANYLKLGLVYDTRDQEANPMQGMWTEALVTMAPSFMGTETPYTQLTITHRQYFTILPKDLSFAYRLGYQTALGDHPPFYMLPYYNSSYKTEEGLGGSKSLRGVLKNRVIGSTVGFANLEMRWKFFRTVVAGQNLYLALNAFTDMGEVLKPFEVTGVNLPESASEGLHISYGGGFRIALNENFIVAVDYGRAKDSQDGNSGLYIGLGYLY